MNNASPPLPYSLWSLLDQVKFAISINEFTPQPFCACHNGSWFSSYFRITRSKVKDTKRKLKGEMTRWSQHALS